MTLGDLKFAFFSAYLENYDTFSLSRHSFEFHLSRMICRNLSCCCDCLLPTTISIASSNHQMYNNLCHGEKLFLHEQRCIQETKLWILATKWKKKKVWENYISLLNKKEKDLIYNQIKETYLLFWMFLVKHFCILF